MQPTGPDQSHTPADSVEPSAPAISETPALDAYDDATRIVDLGLPKPDHLDSSPIADAPAPQVVAEPTIREDLEVGHPNRIPDEYKVPKQGPLTAEDDNLLKDVYGDQDKIDYEQHKLLQHPESHAELEKLAAFKKVAEDLKQTQREVQKIIEDTENNLVNNSIDMETADERSEANPQDDPEEVIANYKAEQAKDNAAQAIITRGNTAPVTPITDNQPGLRDTTPSVTINAPTAAELMAEQAATEATQAPIAPTAPAEEVVIPVAEQAVEAPQAGAEG